MGSANERRRYIVTSSLLGGTHTQNDPYILRIMLMASVMLYFVVVIDTDPLHRSFVIIMKQ